MPFFLDGDGVESRSLKRKRIQEDKIMAYRDWHVQAASKALKSRKEDEEGRSSSQEQPSAHESPEIRTSNRDELIQCIKRGQRPTWVPKPGLEALCTETNAERDPADIDVFSGDMHVPTDESNHQNSYFTQQPHAERHHQDVLQRQLNRAESAIHLEEIKRPVNVTEKALVPDSATSFRNEEVREHHFTHMTTAPWSIQQPPSEYNRTISLQMPAQNQSQQTPSRSRAPSLGSSLSSSFVMRTPTSPLVYSTNHSTMEIPDDLSATPEERGWSLKRRSMPPNSFNGNGMFPLELGLARTPPTASNPLSTTTSRHKSHRSLSSFTYHPISSPPRPSLAQSRRLSLAQDASPRQHMHMVGSFEESILRGRMSTAPSKPLDFIAQIGVLGKGNCPASLRCPAHVTVPFPAVFYNYSSSAGTRATANDNPSPYVGLIDLEQNLKPVEITTKRRRMKSSSNTPNVLCAKSVEDVETLHNSLTFPDIHQGDALQKILPGGAYRVPQEGQLQIIIKNPNKTAVKLFLIPYNLEGMQPGTKTFIRQRSYTTGPVVEDALSESGIRPATYDPLLEKTLLRYLIHLKFCSPIKGRFYLYDNIRVVFANRMPDGKEKLRNDVQLPDPKFTPYRPHLSGRRSSTYQNIMTNTTAGIFDKSFDIRNGQKPPMNDSPVHSPTHEKAYVPFQLSSQVSPPAELDDASLHIRLSDYQICDHTIKAANSNTPSRASPTTFVSIPGFFPSTSTRNSPVPWGDSPVSAPKRRFSPTPVEVGDGLLSRKLREMHQQPDDDHGNTAHDHTNTLLR